ncbi:MAG: cytoskeleton protein RodZ [Gammaproteobacteria bacterium]|jgi:cytoskeleton protein RodZ
MSAVDQAPNMSADKEAPTGPGGLLRAARENDGISLRDIAAQLHLDERTIDSLEDDDFQNLPAPTFVRGYLRGYARLLGVPVGPVMEAFDREGFRPPDLVADIAEEPESNATDFPINLITWVIALVLGAMVVVWWNNNNQELGDLLNPIARDELSSSAVTDIALTTISTSNADLPKPTMAQPSATDGTQRAIDTPNAALTQAPQGSPSTTQQPISADNLSPRDSTLRAEQVLAQAREVITQSRQVVDSSTAAANNQEPARTQAPLGAQEPVQIAAVADSLQAAAPPVRSSLATGVNRAAPIEPATQSPSAAANQPTQTSAAQQSAVGQARLQLTFSAKSWVQVMDSNDKRLFYDLAKPGQTLELRGHPPLQVTLGRTRGVQVRFNDTPFDFAPFISKGVARFTLR